MYQNDKIAIINYYFRDLDAKNVLEDEYIKATRLEIEELFTEIYDLLVDHYKQSMEIKIPSLPSGRYRDYCTSGSAEEWRDDVMIPALKEGDVTVRLESELGMPASWCEEAFGGLVRALGVDVLDRITLLGDDSCVNEACMFMQEAVDESA